ncbi:MAG: glycosyltransferase [Flavobacteriales bacterium]|nr:glycosyltransferase [Flavobacteriales bacterium]
MIAVSVVVPVYNSADYLDECIQSLLAQTLTNCEFIFVNDGSKDNSQNIIELHQKYDSRIVLINQENQGVSVARTNGIAIAKGNYIGFVDADDTVEKDMFQTLYTVATQNQVDVVVSRVKKEQDGVVVSHQHPFAVDTVFDFEYIHNQIIPYMIQKDNLNSACNKIYKLDFINQHQIRFPKGVALGEDGLFNMKALSFAKNIFFTNYTGYFYREVIGSATRNIIEKDYFKQTLAVYQFDFSEFLNRKVNIKNEQQLKGLRLIEKVVAIVAIYLNAKNSGSFSSRYRYVRNMIHNEEAQKNIRQLWTEVTRNKSKFEKFILYCIKSKWMFCIVLATQYSYLRNKK